MGWYKHTSITFQLSIIVERSWNQLEPGDWCMKAFVELDYDLDIDSWSIFRLTIAQHTRYVCKCFSNRCITQYNEVSILPTVLERLRNMLCRFRRLTCNPNPNPVPSWQSSHKRRLSKSAQPSSPLHASLRSVMFCDMTVWDSRATALSTETYRWMGTMAAMEF